MIVADWSQAEIGYTRRLILQGESTVADWSQAEIGYTLLVLKTFLAKHLETGKEIKIGVIDMVA
jgi:hypothetical protein